MPAGTVTPAISVCAGPRPAQVLSDWFSLPYPEAPAAPFPLLPVWGVQGTGMDVPEPVPVGSVQTSIRVRRGWSPARALLAPHSPGFSKPLPEPRPSRATSKTFCLPHLCSEAPAPLLSPPKTLEGIASPGLLCSPPPHCTGAGWQGGGGTVRTLQTPAPLPLSSQSLGSSCQRCSPHPRCSPPPPLLKWGPCPSSVVLT